MNDHNGGMPLPEDEPKPQPKAKAPRPEPVDAKAVTKRAGSDGSGGGVQDEDLSAEIASTLPRERGEQVTCRRITKNHYRCNWWRAEDKAAYDNPSMGGLLVTTNRICKSQFLRVTREAGAAGGVGGLCITVVTAA